MKFAFIDGHASEYPVALACRVLGVSRSGFYAWRHRRDGEPSARTQSDHWLRRQIEALFHEHRGRYGAPRLHAELRERSVRVGRKRVARLMRQAELRAARPHRAVRTTDSDHARPVAENVLGRQFAVAAPNARWAADLTYIPTDEGWLYLAVVLDLGSRHVVGHATSPRLERGLVLAALEVALGRRAPQPGLVHAPRPRQPIRLS